MRLSLVEDFDDGDEGSSPSQDSVSLDIPHTQHKQTGSYTNLFDTSQPTPVGATYQQSKVATPQHARPKDLRYDRSPRPIPMPRVTKPPLAMPEELSPTDSSKPRTNIVNSPGGAHSYSKPPVGQGRSTHYTDRGHNAGYNSKINGYPPARSSSVERFRDMGRNDTGYSRYPDEGTRRSADQLDQRREQYNQQGNSRTLPNQNRNDNSAAANHNAQGDDGHVGEDGDYKRPMSFVKALEMSEVMQKAREKDTNDRLRNEEKKKSVYDSSYEISV